MVKDKLVLKKIAKRWCQSILLSNDITDTEIYKLINEEEADYIVSESRKIAYKIYNGEASQKLSDIIKEEFDFE